LTFSATATSGSVTSGPAVVYATKLAATDADTVGPNTLMTQPKNTTRADANPTCTGTADCLTMRKGCATTLISPLVGYGAALVQYLVRIPPQIPPHLPNVPSPNSYACSGRFQIVGNVNDDWSGARGAASEVADVVILIKDDAGNVVKEAHSFFRRGPAAFFNASFRIADFEINKSYTWSVQSFDAWGNAGNTQSGSFTPEPQWAIA
jgi:hypothetical protein